MSKQIGAVHKLCRLKIVNFWPPHPLILFAIFLLSKLPPYRDDM